MNIPEKKQNKKQETNNNNKCKQISKEIEEQENRIKKDNNNKNSIYTNSHTITSKLFSPAYFPQKILSGYHSDDIYKKERHPLPLWHHN